jgi:hypothetical protein
MTRFDSPHHQYGELTSHRITDTESRRLTTNTESFLYKKFRRKLPVLVIRGVGYLPYQQHGESANLYISDMHSRRLPVSTIWGVDFNKQYLCEFEAKIAELNSCSGELCRTDLYIKNRKIGLIAMFV